MSTSSKIVVEECTDDDMPEFFSVMSRAFGHDAPFVDMYFPNHDMEKGQVQDSKRFAAWRNYGTSSFIKAVFKSGDENQDRIIGIAVWTHMKQAPSANIEDLEDVASVWPAEDDAEYMKRLWAKYVVPRTHAVNTSKGAGVYGVIPL